MTMAPSGERGHGRGYAVGHWSPNDSGSLGNGKHQHTDPSPTHAGSVVDWYEVFLWAQRKLANVESWPAAGSPEWCALSDNAPGKWAAAIDAAPHHILRMAIGQEQQANTPLSWCPRCLAKAGREISDGSDWAEIGRYIKDHREFVAAHPWARRVR
jgi:hypothetical protein